MGVDVGGAGIGSGLAGKARIAVPTAGDSRRERGCRTVISVEAGRWETAGWFGTREIWLCIESQTWDMGACRITVRLSGPSLTKTVLNIGGRSGCAAGGTGIQIVTYHVSGITFRGCDRC